MESETSDTCNSQIFDVFTCDNADHLSPHVFKRRHAVNDIAGCTYCQSLRVRTVIAKAHDRHERSEVKDQMVLWTLGTNLEDNQDNRATIKSWWKLFGSRMRTYSKRKGYDYRPVMNCLEKGSKGGRLHYHFIALGKLPHKEVLEAWRSITQLPANVNYSILKIDTEEPGEAFSYLAKYLAKDGLAYYWMGPYLKAGESEYKKELNCTLRYLWEDTEFNRAVQTPLNF